MTKLCFDINSISYNEMFLSKSDDEIFITFVGRDEKETCIGLSYKYAYKLHMALDFLVST